MKKTLLSAIAATTLLTTSASAGVILDFEVGAGMWNAAPSGEINYGTNLDLENNLGLESSTNTYLYADFNHFVPIVPNVRVEKQDLTTDATKSLGGITFNGASFDVNTKTTVDLSQNDLLLYWGVPLLKTATAGIVRVDFGLDIKQFKGAIEMTSGTTKTADLDFAIPMGYLGARIDPPFIPAMLDASYKTISYKDSSLQDITAKVLINLPIPIPLLDFRAEIGYKEQSLKLDSELTDNLGADMKFSGVIFGVSAKF